MNVAFLFNSDHPRFNNYYGPPIMDRILGTGVLQKYKRNMRVSVGDILTHLSAGSSKTPTITYLISLCHAVYKPIVLDRLISNRLEDTYGKETVYCWMFQNMTAQIANELHEKLSPDDAYLGSMDVDFSEPQHLYFFRNSLFEAYRFNGLCCSVFFEMGENEDPDIVKRECFEEHGFTVIYEDQGARRTFCDNYDTIEHFKRVASFKDVFSKIAGLDADHSSDLAHSLEELHPKLFDAFASAARTLERAETAEDFAQAALSGRRLLEQTADYLFPPRDSLLNGRKVGQREYKNRLWAYIKQNGMKSNCEDSDTLDRIGKETDRLVDLFNAGLHADPTREKVESAFCSLVIWLSDVIDLNHEAARKPYLAYEKEVMSLYGDIIKDLVGK